MNKFKALVAVTGIAVVVIIAAACGNGAESNSDAVEPAEPPAVAPAAGASPGVVAVSGAAPAETVVTEVVTGVSPSSSPSSAPVIVTGGTRTGISVTGEGTITMEPDLAVLNVGVETTADNVAKARSQAADAMNAIVAALKARGISNRDIQTRFFDISPRYEFAEVSELGVRTRKQVLIGYSVSNSASVKIRDLDATGTIIDEVAEAGGDIIRINGIRFTVEDPKPFTLELREAAVKDAIDKASHLASLAGVSLGRLLFITESGSGVPVTRDLAMRSFAAVEMAAAPTPIGGGELEIRMTVQAMFEIM